MRACVCVCVRACVRVHGRVRVRACVRVRMGAYGDVCAKSFRGASVQVSHFQFFFWEDLSFSVLAKGTTRVSPIVDLK